MKAKQIFTKKTFIRLFDLLYGLIIFAIGVNMILFPGIVIWLFFAGVIAKGFLELFTYFCTKKSDKFNLTVGLVSIAIGTVVLFSDSDGWILGFIPIAILLSFWAILNGVMKIRRGVRHKSQERKKWIATVVSGTMTLVLGLTLFVSPFTPLTDFIGFAGIITGVTFIVLGITSFVAAVWETED